MKPSNNNAQTKRIRQMERHLKHASAALKRLSSALDKYDEAKADIAALSDYYGSDLWKQDLADDEAGLLPKNLKRGVLAEDSIWNVLEAYRELQERTKR